MNKEILYNNNNENDELTTEDTPIAEKKITVEELDSILNETEEIINYEEKTEEALGKIKTSTDELEAAKIKRDNRLNKVENFHPEYLDLSPDNYDLLIKDGTITKEEATQYQRLDQIIETIQNKQYPSAEEITQLEKLSQIKNNFIEKIHITVESLKKTVKERQDDAREHVLKHYQDKSEKLKATIENLKQDPQVQKKLEEIELQNQKEQEEKEMQELQNGIKEIGIALKSVETKNQNAIKKIAEIFNTTEEDAKEQIMGVYLTANQEQKTKILDSLRKNLIQAVQKEGEGQLVPSDIMMWRDRYTPSKRNYFDDITFLKSKASADIIKRAQEKGITTEKDLQGAIIEARDMQYAVQTLVGDSKHIATKKQEQGRKVKFSLDLFFDQTKAKEATEMTKIVKRMSQDINSRIEKNKEIEDLVAQGGIKILTPINRFIRGKKKTIGYERGAVLLEDYISKQGIKGKTVVNVVGNTEGIKVGQVYKEDLSNAVEHLREAAK